MASTTFIDNQTTIFADWLNDVNSAVYDGTFPNGSLSLTTLNVTGAVTGAGFTSLINNALSAPGAIGSATPNTGAFTTLSATTLNATTLNASGVTTPLPLKGTTSGTVSLAVPAVAGTNTITFPSGSGTVAVQGLSSNIVSGTAVATTSGTNIDFTGIPSWVKRISIIFNGVSTNGTSYKQVQIGSGSFTTSGYTGRIGYILQPNGAAITSLTTGLGIDAFQLANETTIGIMTIDLLGSNTYVSSSQVTSMGSVVIGFANSSITLGGVLDRLRITTVNGTDTFDAGSINILYE
jgi:hypothetical protein